MPRGRKNMPPGPGRPKGSKNKFTSLKNSFLAAFMVIGGEEGLANWARRNRGKFYQLVARMLPNRVENVPAELDLSKLSDAELIAFRAGRLSLDDVKALIENRKEDETHVC